MKKGSILIGFMICFVIPAISQQWDSLPRSKKNDELRALYADTLDNYLYMSGRFFTINGKHMKGIARWNGVEWDSLGAGIDGMDHINNGLAGGGYCMTRYNNELYVGGGFFSLGDRKAIAIGKWNGVSWDSLAVQPFRSSWNRCVWDITVINNELYVGGSFDTVAGIPTKGIAKWDGNNWSSLNFNLLNYTVISSIVNYNNEIYVGGLFFDQVSNDGTRNIMKYDGVSWTKVGGGVSGDHIASMVVYNNELYVAGLFLRANGNAGNYIQKWNGTAWSDVGGGMAGVNNNPFDNAQIHKLLVYKNKLYAFGTQRYAGGVPAQCVSVWDGTNWCGLGSVFDNRILTGAFYKDTLYVGGGFWTIDGDSINSIAKWKGGNYTDTCGNLTGITDFNTKNDFAVYPNPTNSTFIIETNITKNENIKITLYNVMGESVLNIEEESISTRYQKQIDIEKLPAGIYFLSFQTEGYNTIKKIVKQ